MARIVPKLNLNRTPQIVENNSLIFAKNIKILKDGSINTDDGISVIAPINDYVDAGYRIVGYIPYNTCIYFFLVDINGKSIIVKYDEKNPGFVTTLDTAWSYSGIKEYPDETGHLVTEFTTKVEGEVIVNLNSDVILIVIEHGNDELNIPIKFININRSSSEDDESIYTQSPKMPLLNLLECDKYVKVIPNGVYQFFVRFEIKEDFYTGWIPCSKELFAGTAIKSDTIQGSIKYIDITSDSSESFVFTVDRLSKYTYGYRSFQIGFILSHDDSTVARAWKHFDLNTDKIYFDYDKNYIEEVNIDEMLDSVYQIYNPKNITNFKNKVYISNYKESNINPDFSNLASKIEVDIKYKELSNETANLYKGKDLKSETIPGSNIEIFTGFEDDEDSLQGYIDKNLLMLYGYGFHATYDDRDLTYYDGPYNTLQELYNTLQELYDAINSFWDNNHQYEISKLSFSIEGQEEINYITEENKDDYIYPFDSGVSWTKRCTDGYDLAIKIISDGTFNSNVNFGGFDAAGYVYTKAGKKFNSIDIKVERYSLEVETRYIKVKDQWDRDVDKAQYYIRARATGCNIKLNNFINVAYLSYKNIQYNYQSLLPFKSYAFYVHYVKESGETTNGYFITERLITIPSTQNREASNKKIIYPTFTNIEYPDDYHYCFISIVDTKNNIAEIFGDNCVDIDSLLLPLNKNIKVYSLDQLNEYIRTHPNAKYFDTSDRTNEPLTTVDYIYSGKVDQRFIDCFGATGKLLEDIGESDSPTNIDGCFVVNQNEENQEYIALTKCTPYLNKSFYNDYENLNLLGYICSVYKPTVDEKEKYISGSDVYKKTVANNTLDVSLITDYNQLQVKTTETHVVYSEYNLNYLSLAQEISTRIIGAEKEDNQSGQTETLKKKVLIQSLESLILSDIYELKSMYKDYRKKLFYPIDKDVINTFDNTIRASEVHSDEGTTYVLKFEALHYYNVPTNKGYIVNLKAIADKILVHTQDGLFSFSGSSKLTTQDGNANLEESDPFDTGITEIFGSERGFVGLSDKNHTMICYDGYFFFDKDAKTIYDYTGQGLTLLSDPIERLLGFSQITDVVFANDYYNDRFFMMIKFNNDFVRDTYVTLSFNYKQKTFVSLHDFIYDESFSTKTNCYFIRNNKCYIVNKESDTYSGLTYYDNIYPTCFNIEDIKPDVELKFKSIVDVIYNDMFETVKTLNAISWIASKINNEFPTLELGHDPNDCLAEADTQQGYAVDNVMIYSDSCKTENYNISEKDFYNNPNKSLLEYKMPSFNNGFWTYNFFRNILTDKRNFDTADNKSLVYGKYFVVRFTFDNDIKFKLENIIFNV